MNPCCSPQLVSSHPGLQINQSTTVPQRLTFDLSFSMCISREAVCSCVTFILYQISKLGFFTSQTWTWSAGLCEDHRPPGFFCVFVINPSEGDPESLFYYISNKRNNIGFYAGVGRGHFALTRLVFGFIPRISKGSDGSMWYLFWYYFSS